MSGALPPALRVCVALALRDIRLHRARTWAAVLVVLVAAAAASTALTTVVRAVAPGSTLSGTTATATVDEHTVRFLMMVAIVALTLATVLVVPVFLVGFRRQVRELGQLAAAGAVPRQLISVVLTSALTVGALGGGGGTVLGLVIGTVITGAPGRPSLAQVVLPLVAALGLTVGLLVLCALCAAYPARLAARLDIMAALRDRVPSAARRSWASRPKLALACVTVALGAPGTLLLRLGSAGGSAPALAGGVLLATAALCGLAALVALVVIGAPVTRPLAARYALRDAGRHLLQILPGASAGAALIAALVAGVVFAGTSSAAETRSYVPVAPVGGALVLAGAEQARDAVSAVAGVRAEARVRTVVGSASWLVLPVAGAPRSLDARPNALNDGGALLGDPELIELFDLPDAAAAALARGQAVGRTTLADAIDDGTLDVRTSTGVVEIPTVAALPVSAPAALLLPAELIDSMQLQLADAGTVVMAARPLVAGDEPRVHEALADGWVMVETGPPAVSATPTQYGLTALACLLTFLVVLLLTTLTREESAADARTLEAVGASPGFVRRAGAVKASVQTGAAAVCGVPAGVGLGLVLLDVRASWIPGTVVEAVIPWSGLAAVILLLPPLVAVAAGAAGERSPALARRSS